MSLDAIRAAFEVTGIDPTAKFVLVAIANRANADGRAWPSAAALAADTGLHRASIFRAIDTLVEADVLTVIHRKGRSNVLTVEGVAQSDRGVAQNDSTRRTERHRTSKEPVNYARAARALAENPKTPARYFLPGSGWIEDFTTNGGNGVHP